jgi:subtilisin family serine protease
MRSRTIVLVLIVSAWTVLGRVDEADAAGTPPAWQQKVTPAVNPDTVFAGQQKNITWIRDRNHDFVDDLIDSLFSPGDSVDVIVDLNLSMTPNSIRIEFAPFGRVRYIGRVLTSLLLDDVAFTRMDSLASLPFVAMVEWQAPIRPAVVYATRAVQARANTSEPRYRTSAESRNLTGAGVKIAILDTGVIHGHQSIPRRVHGFDAVVFEDVNGPRGAPNGIDDTCDSPPIGDGDCTDPEDEPQDGTKDPCAGGTCSQHGTHVAGVALGRGINRNPTATPPSTLCAGPNTPSDEISRPRNCVGTASGAGLVDVRVCENDYRCAMTDVNEGLDWLALNARRLRLRVANLSWVVCANDDPSGMINSLVDSIVASGTVVVAAHGNRGTCVSSTPCDQGDSLRGSPAPGSASLALTVSAVNDQNTIHRDYDIAYAYGIHGPTCSFDPRNPVHSALKPDVSAPGEEVWAPVPGTANWYAAMSGTSIATAHVSGVAAILLGANSALRPGEVARLIRRTADPPIASKPYLSSFDPFWSNEFGMGIVNVDAALRGP